MTDQEKEARKKVVALRYQEERERAPRVVAKGAGHLAERIIEIAKENDITFYEDSQLTNLLSQVDLQVEIPEELYMAVAKVLAFIYGLDGRLSGAART